MKKFLRISNEVIISTLNYVFYDKALNNYDNPTKIYDNQLKNYNKERNNYDKPN